jgi:glycosyltransferase involved in cell wall biosynthesis
VISVITPAYHSPDELLRAVASLEAQTYTGWQHVIVADGPDPELREQMAGLGYAGHGRRVFAELGRNWHGFRGGDKGGRGEGPGERGGRGSRGAEAANVATHLAGGDLIAYLDQDCEYFPHHLEVHAAALAGPEPGFSYTRMQRRIDGKQLGVVGNGIPGHGRIDGNAVVHRAELLRLANWTWGGDSDWGLIWAWIQAGAKWKFMPEVTVRWYHSASDM